MIITYFWDINHEDLLRHTRVKIYSPIALIAIIAIISVVIVGNTAALLHYLKVSGLNLGPVTVTSHRKSLYQNTV